MEIVIRISISTQIIQEHGNQALRVETQMEYGKPDTNIDTDGDGKADSKDYRPAIDKDGDGVDDYWKPRKIVEIGDIKYGTGNPFD